MASGTFNLVLVDPVTGAVVHFSEVYTSMSGVRNALNRDPDADENGIISWGDVGPDELERLLMDPEDPDEEGFEDVTRLQALYAGKGYFWSLFFNERENGTPC